MGSRVPRTRQASYRAPGPLGRNDLAEPSSSTPSAGVGDSPGTTGRNDYAQSVANGLARTPPGTAGVHGRLRYVVYLDSVQVGGDRNWRNNNPGNMEYGEFARQHGAIGGDGRFAIFPDWDTGRGALRALLQTQAYQQLSIGNAIARFAPPSENDTAAYGRYIQQRTGLAPDAMMNALSAAQLDAVVDAVTHFEGGHAGTVYHRGDSNLPGWVNSLLGVSATTPTVTAPLVPSPPIPIPYPNTSIHDTADSGHQETLKSLVPPGRRYIVGQ